MGITRRFGAENGTASSAGVEQVCPLSTRQRTPGIAAAIGDGDVAPVALQRFTLVACFAAVTADVVCF